MLDLLAFFSIWLFYLTDLNASPITYENVRGTSYTVSYDHRAITINGNRTMLIAGAIHYPRSTPGMWPYIMKKAKEQGLNTVQTYVFWNIHEQRRGTYDFSDRANLHLFLQTAANAGLFVNLRIGPYVCAEWNYGGLPAWLNQEPNISFRSHNEVWEREMKRFLTYIIDYVDPFLAKNGGPIILAQIENEYNGIDQAYVDWCGSLVSNDFARTEIPWIMCNGRTAHSTIETCNSCNCVDDGWVERHHLEHPNQPMIFTENEGWFQPWGEAVAIRTTTDVAYSVAEWFAAGGAYHSYYMWHGGNNYGRTAASGITTMYADDVPLHADGTPNEPKYTQLSRLQHLIAERASGILNQDPFRIPLPYWDGKKWTIGIDQFVYSYSSSTHFIINRFNRPCSVLFHNKNISMNGHSVRIYDDNLSLLWDSANVTDIPSNNTHLIPAVPDPLIWQIWSEPTESMLPMIISTCPQEQLTITNDETVYLWYRRNITLFQPRDNTVIQVQTRKANAFHFFLDGVYLGEFDNRDHSQGPVTGTIAVDLSYFRPNQVYSFEILSITLGLDNGVHEHIFEYKGIVGDIWLDGQSLSGDEKNPWEHQKGLVGEYFQIYTEQGSSKVNWNRTWTTGIDRPITWLQTRFDLNHLVRNDLNANPILLDAHGLNRGHAYINGHDLGLYWLLPGVCRDQPPCCCQQAQINCNQPTQRYYHIPSDWLVSTNNLLTIFEDSGAPSPNSVRLVQRIVTTEDF